MTRYSLLVAAVVGLASSGCIVDRAVDTLEQTAVSSVAEHVRQPLPSDALEARPNVKGEGVLVVNRAARSPDERYAWLFVRGGTFALDRRTQRITPELALLEDAPEEARTAARVGQWKTEELIAEAYGRPD